MSVVDLRLGKKDGDDHLFIRIGDEWRGDLRIGLIIGHVSIMTPSSHLEIHLFISLFFTSFNGASPDYITYVFSSTKDNHLYWGHHFSNSFAISSARLKTYYALTAKALKLWNTLPLEIKYDFHSHHKFQLMLTT